MGLNTFEILASKYDTDSMKYEMMLCLPSAHFKGDYSIQHKHNSSLFSIKTNERAFLDFNLKRTNHTISFNFLKSKEEGSLVIGNLCFDKIDSDENQVPSNVLGELSKFIENTSIMLTRKFEEFLNHILLELMFENISELTEELIKQHGGANEGVLGEKLCLVNTISKMN